MDNEQQNEQRGGAGGESAESQSPDSQSRGSQSAASASGRTGTGDAAGEREPEWTGGQEVEDPVDEETTTEGVDVPAPEEDEQSQVRLDSSE
jgi:hypothetical protein